MILTGSKRNSWSSPTISKIEIRERKPTLNGNQVALRMILDIPSALFERPVLEAKMVIPEAAVPQSNITVEVTTDIEKIIKERTGLDLKVNVVPFEKPDPAEQDGLF